MGCSTWSCYLVIRTITWLVDLGTDLVNIVRLYHSEHYIWGSLMLTFPFLAILMSMLCVIVGRIRRGDGMPAKKYVLLTMRCLIATYEAFFESAPQLVLQLTIVWRGVLHQDYWLLISEEAIGSFQWFLSLASVLGFVSSFFSFIVSAMYCNQEAPNSQHPAKFVLALLLCTVASIYRVFVASILFSFAHFETLGVAVLLYLTNVLVHKSNGHSWETLLFSFTSLFCPTGYTNNLGQTASIQSWNHTQYCRPSVSEVERARVNQETRTKRVHTSLILFNTLNLLLMIAFALLVELKLLSDTASPKPLFIPLALDRLFLYLTASSMLVVCMLCSCGYAYQVRRVRDCVRAWQATSSPRHLLTKDQTANVQPNAPPLLPDQNLPLYPRGTPYIEVLHNRAAAGTSKCRSDDCITCCFMIEGTVFRSTVTGKEYRFTTPVSCFSMNVVYLVTCKKCLKQYVGKTKQELKKRHYGHRREIETASTPLGKHFAEACGYLSWSIQIIDQTETDDLQRREGYWQHELSTFVPLGLNSRDELSRQLQRQTISV